LYSKGIYPKELAKKEIYGVNNEYGSTIVSLSEDLRRNMNLLPRRSKRELRH